MFKMELLRQVSNTQFLFPAAAVAVVLVCAALVFIFGFHTAEQPQFDKLPLVVDDRKSSNKKRKIKEKKSSPNRISNEDAKVKSENSKKSPSKEKTEEKVKEEKPKPKEKVESKIVKREAPIKEVEVKKGKKGKAAIQTEKPVDFDEGVWEEVPKKSDKKKPVKQEEKEKKDSPAKKNKKKAKEAETEASRSADGNDKIKILSAEGPGVSEDAAKALQAQVEELQRVLKEAERRDQGLLEDVNESDLPEVKDLRSNKKKENKEKQSKKKSVEAPAVANNIKDEKSKSESDNNDEKPAGPVFDELGDTWTDTKVSKKSKKKARKDQ